MAVNHARFGIMIHVFTVQMQPGFAPRPQRLDEFDKQIGARFGNGVADDRHFTAAGFAARVQAGWKISGSDVLHQQVLVDFCHFLPRGLDDTGQVFSFLRSGGS